MPTSTAPGSAAAAPDAGQAVAAQDPVAAAAQVRRITETLVCGFLPGALVGAHLAGLLFILNTALPWSAMPVFRAVCWYALELGLSSVALRLPLLAVRRPRARRVLPWTLTASF